MFSLFLGFFGTWLTFVGSCDAGNLERSSVAPLSIVYTVYPYYNSERLLGLWREPEESLRLSSNVVAIERSTGEQETGNNEESMSSDETSSQLNSYDSYRNHFNESTQQRNEKTTEITYWPPIQRGAAPKPRLSRATVLQPANLKKSV